MQIANLKCTGCGAEYAADTLMNLWPEDNRPVQLIMDLERLGAEQPDNAWYDPSRKSMWRFGALLPLDVQDPSDCNHIVSLGEGCTPQLNYDDHALAEKLGFRLSIKDEGKAHHGYGANPTQSFKDRGMSMTASMASWHGLNKLAVPTQGNAGDSLCSYAEAAGMSAVVAMPRNTPLPILGRVASLAVDSEDFHLKLVDGTIREAGELLKKEWLGQGWFSVATFQEPGWRIEGKKTLGLEIAEPTKPGQRWSLPDVIVYPTGGGTGVLGMWKAFSELEALGLIGAKRPRIVCVQSAATQPLVSAFDDGITDTVAKSAGDTLAYGLNVPGGVGHFRVLEIVRESGGTAVAIPESDIHSALSSIWKEKDWWICPEGAACIAAIPRLVDEGHIKPGDEVVVCNTGSLEKYLPDLRHLL
ncbi:MAG: threonine synthase [Pseudomonadota bacterium]